MKIPPIDLLSFFLGFCSALLIVFVISRIIKLLPQLKKNHETRKQRSEVSDFQESERQLKITMLRKCQHSHLAAALFPLNDVYVDMKLIGRPFYSNPEYILENEPAVFQHFPISYGDPVGFADLPAPLLSLEDALSGGRNLVISNEIGAGKTTLLAHFTSQILEQKCKSEVDNKLLPLFIHICELNYAARDGASLLADIAGLLHEKNTKINYELLNELFRSAENSTSLILLLDGLDELSLENFDKAISYIQSIMKEFPRLRIVVASGPNYLGNILKLGFAELSIQALNSSMRLELMQLWLKAWLRLCEADNKMIKPDQLSPLWLLQDAKNYQVLDFTQAIWTSLAFDREHGKANYFYDFVMRTIRGVISLETLIGIADKIAADKFTGISYKDLRALIGSDQIFLQSKQDKPVEKDSVTNREDNPRFTTIEDIIDYFLEIGFFVENRNEFFSFQNPSVLSFLLAQSNDFKIKMNWRELLTSSMDYCIHGHYQGEVKHIENWINDADPDIHRNLVLAIDQIKKCPQGIQYYSLLAKKVFPLIVNESLPASRRLKLFSVFALNSQSQSQLLERLKKESSPTVRQIVALEYGKIGNSKAVASLRELLSDVDSLVEMASCLALYRIFNTECVDILVDVLLNGRDSLQIFVAELFAFKPIQGHAILKELAENGNIKSKKAAIRGLRLIPDQWSNDLLEKISTAEDQWFVRDAAAHALETKWNISHYIPSRRSSPEETSWLIKYASKGGHSLPVGVYPYDLLYELIDTGTLEEKLVSLSYLTDKPNKKIIERLVQLIKTDNDLREESFFKFCQFAAQMK